MGVTRITLKGLCHLGEGVGTVALLGFQCKNEMGVVNVRLRKKICDIEGWVRLESMCGIFYQCYLERKNLGRR